MNMPNILIRRTSIIKNKFNKELLNKYNAKWNKISNLLKVEFDSDPVTQLNINFHCNKTPEENQCYA